MRPFRPLVTLLGRLAVVTAALLLLAACGDASPGTATDDTSSLDGDWMLTAASVDGDDLDLSAGEVTLSVQGDRWGGRSACNQYSTTVTADGDSVTVGPTAGTEMACVGGAMDLESSYLAALQRVTGAQRDGDMLTLSGDGVDLEFAPVPEVPQADLVGTSWQLTTLLSGDTASSVTGEPTLLLAEDGTVTGSTGCRAFRGAWKQHGDDLVIGPLATPKIGCPPDLQAQDSEVLKVLDGAVRVTQDGGQLTLERGNLGLVYTAA